MTATRQFEQECSILSDKAPKHCAVLRYIQRPRNLSASAHNGVIGWQFDPVTRAFLTTPKSTIALDLTYLHSNGIIHRDLSSNNAGTRAKVTDFGMAKYFDENSTTMTPFTLMILQFTPRNWTASRLVYWAFKSLLGNTLSLALVPKKSGTHDLQLEKSTCLF